MARQKYQIKSINIYILYEVGFDMGKMLIKTLVLVFATFLFTACNRQSTHYPKETSGINKKVLVGNENTATQHNHSSVFDVAKDKPETGYEKVDEIIKYVTLPNGTRVDTRIDDEVVDLIFRHFEAIENGDVVAFRETLQGQDGASINMHLGLITRYFWDIVVADYQYEMFFDGEMGAGMTELGWQRVFHEEFPPVSRNTGMLLREIKQSNTYWGVVVTLQFYAQNEVVLFITVLDDFGFPGIESSRVLEQ